MSYIWRSMPRGMFTQVKVHGYCVRNYATLIVKTNYRFNNKIGIYNSRKGQANTTVKHTDSHNQIIWVASTLVYLLFLIIYLIDQSNDTQKNIYNVSALYNASHVISRASCSITTIMVIIFGTKGQFLTSFWNQWFGRVVSKAGFAEL